MWEIWFERLFKFTQVNFQEGNIVIQAGKFIYLLAPLLLLILAGALVIYLTTNIYFSKSSKAISFTLKALALILLFLPLFEPSLMVPDIIPDESFVVVMVDRSQSMSIKDGENDQTRLDYVRHLLENEETGILNELEENFKIRFYEFGGDASRPDSVDYSSADKDDTNLTASLQRVVSDYKGLPLAGILMFTDGGDNSEADPLSIVEELRDMNIPIHIVGVGSEAFENEREILEVNAGKGLAEGTGAEVDVKIRSWNEESGPVNVSLYKGDEVVHTEKKFLKGGGKIDYFSFFYEPEAKEAGKYTLRIDPAENEINVSNNDQSILINTQKDSIRVLYFEGHLRTEFKFTKRALEDDQVVEFTSVSRTGTGKYFRQGIKDPNELSGGFPVAEEELNKFKAVIFGDVEASFFTIDQLRMVEDFVKNRGGGFLMLGGNYSFVEGDYWDTPIANLLPVELDKSRRQIIPELFHDPNISLSEEGGYKYVPTRIGLENPIQKLASEIGSNRSMWDEMPPLTSINYFGEVKPGATVLAVKEKDRFGEEEPILLVQRYGKGRVAALATASTWRWQLMRDKDDQRHERFWRQLVRWLITSAPDKVNINLATNVYAPGDEIPVSVKVYDEDYDPVELASVRGKVTGPDGTENDINFRSDLNEDGVYISSYVPSRSGVFDISVEAYSGESLLGKHDQKILSRPSKKEYYDAVLKRTFLRDLAERNGGFYYDANNTSLVTDNMKTRKTSTSVYKTDYLWDMPVIYLLALILLSAEWIYRRRKGMP